MSLSSINQCTFVHSTDEVGILDESELVEGISGPIFMDGVQCSGEENNLKICDFTMEHMCSHEDDIGIICHRKTPFHC